MALMYVPKQNNQAQMFSLLTNLMMQKIGHKQRMEVADQQTKSATALFNAKTAQDKVNLEEKRTYAEGQTKETRKYDEAQLASKQAYDLKKQKPMKIEQFNPKTGLTDIYLAENRDGKWQLGKTPVGTAQPKGFKFKQGKDGTFSFVSGGMPPDITEPTTGFKTTLQKEIDSMTGQKQRLQDMGSLFKPEYQRWGTKAQMYWRGVKEKAQGLPGAPPVSDQDRKELTEYTSFRSKSGEQFSKALHDAAGGTLTKTEAKVHGRWLANAGKNSESEYMANLQSNYSGLSKALARKNYYLNVEKMDPTQFNKLRNQNKLMSVAQFDSMIDKKYAEELTKLRQEKPNVPYEQLKEEALGLIKASFFGF